MTNRVTKTMLLQFLQEMKTNLQEQIRMVGYRVGNMENKTEGFVSKVESFERKTETSFTRLEEIMHRGFSEVRLDIKALQEDLEVTMLTVARHEKKLARL